MAVNGRIQLVKVGNKWFAYDLSQPADHYLTRNCSSRPLNTAPLNVFFFRYKKGELRNLLEAEFPDADIMD